jgi:hypothetical protein
MSIEYISYEHDDVHEWVCICGNRPTSAGFFPCDSDGKRIEPTAADGWNDLYVCDRCGRIIDQSTRRVLGRAVQQSEMT